jgi:hypothetical protein
MKEALLASCSPELLFEGPLVASSTARLSLFNHVSSVSEKLPTDTHLFHLQHQIVDHHRE